MIKRILVANRGEIAVRIIRCCREMGIETVAVYSKADERSLPVMLATDSVCIGPAKASESYLKMETILEVAKQKECDVVLPTINYRVPDENCDLDIVPNRLRNRKVDVAMSNSLGFGGHNATLLFRKMK